MLEKTQGEKRSTARIIAMPDVHSRSVRSFNMSRVKARGNHSTELRFVELLQQAAIHGWRRRYPVEGKPDFVFPKHRIAIFLDGCFWHSCPKQCKPPPQNSKFWSTKLAVNKRRDRQVTLILRKRDWTVLRFWEHSLKEEPSAVIRRLQAYLQPKRNN
jgi:DNA mismatch endonuclease, patch repair protein